MENIITDEQLISVIEGEQNKELESQIAELPVRSHHQKFL